MKKIMKLVSMFMKLGEKAVSLFNKAIDAADRLIHRKEYLRQKRIAAVFRTMLCVACGVLAVVFFPYKIKVEKNGDFEIRSLMLRISRKTPTYPETQGDGDEFDIVGVEDEDADECRVVSSDSSEQE